MLAPVFIWFAPEMTRKELTGFVGAAFSARRARSAGEWRHSFAWRGSWTTRLSAFCLPLFLAHETAEALETEAGTIPGLMLRSPFLGMAWHSSGAMASRERGIYPPLRNPSSACAKLMCFASLYPSCKLKKEII